MDIRQAVRCVCHDFAMGVTDFVIKPIVISVKKKQFQRLNKAVTAQSGVAQLIGLRFTMSYVSAANMSGIGSTFPIESH